MPPDEQTDVQIEAPDDIRSALMSAIEAQENPETQDTETSANTPARDASGKFVRSDAALSTASEPSEPAHGTAASPVKPDAEKPTAEAAPAQTTEAPQHWNAQDKEVFAELPAKAQAAWLRREREYESGFTKLSNEHAAFRRDYEPVHQMFAPFEDKIRQSGFTKAGLIQAWANVERQLGSGQAIPVIQNLVNSYGVDRAQLARALGFGETGTAPAATDGAPAVQLPPEITQTLQVLMQRQQQIDQTFDQQRQAQHVEATNRVMSTITAFRDAKDPSGTLLHPHYDALESDMVAYLEAARKMGQEPALDELYDKAVWANTSTRDQVLASQRAAAEAQRVEAETKARTEARAKAERARRAGSSVTGAPGSSQAAIAAAKADGGSVRDALMAAIEEHSEAA